MAEETNGNNNWQQQTIEKLALSGLKEQQTARRWSIFFKLLFFVYLLALLFLSFGWIGSGKVSTGSHTALIEIAGVIEAGGDVNADSGIINEEIRRQKRLHPAIPVYAVVEDICASGGYYIAAAADKIYVDKASIVGSIGVLMDSYGFTETMKKLGVERRLLTAGSNKAMLDPFSPVNPKHEAYAQNMLNQIHEQFKTVVREGRGKRLIEDDQIFSGLFWSGEQSIKIGLADALGSADFVAREVIKQKDIVDFTYQETITDRFAKRLGASIVKSIGIDAITKGIQLK